MFRYVLIDDRRDAAHSMDTFLDPATIHRIFGKRRDPQG